MPPNQEVPTRPPSSPTSPNQDHLTRTISFAASSSPPPSRPATSSSRKTSDTPSFSPTKSGLGKGREGTATTKLAWTDTQEERLIFVRSELKKAQRRWSESQEVWLAEVGIYPDSLPLFAMYPNYIVFVKLEPTIKDALMSFTIML